ncbi:MAG: response regulator transcription factor [Chloroflexota bacterium]|nr:response regulator transcription factor [Chloroflexota bacterium]
MSGERIRVAIVDDHPALREGTAGLLAREQDLEIVGVVGSLAEARALADAVDPPHVLVLDIRLGGERGLDLLATPAPPGERRPAIVVWTAYDVPQYAAFAFRAGAAAFVVKTAPTRELIDAIRHAAAGRIHFTSRPDLGGRPLSGREREILERLVRGLSNDEIAADLGVITRTVEAHLTRLYEDFDVRSRTELAARAAREGWLEVPP